MTVPGMTSPGSSGKERREQATLPILRLRGIDKTFPGVHALKNIDWEAQSGEVHALAGENGAGKSTLMHILAGVYPPDSGEIIFGGKSFSSFPSEESAQKEGIGIVFQERSLFPALSVAENIFAGRQPSVRGKIQWRRMSQESAAILAAMRVDLPPRTLVSELSPAQQQMVEIAKALSLQARLLILDEPTAAFTPPETRALFDVIGGLRDRGVAIIYISHRFDEVFEIADRISVLKDGELQGTFFARELTTTRLISLMVGRELPNLAKDRALPGKSPVPRLEVRNLSDPAAGGRMNSLLQKISFQGQSGEILGLAGLSGAGRTELALSVFGARPRGSGSILIDGRMISIASPRDAIAAGIGYLPEDRKGSGLFLVMSIAENIAAGNLTRFNSWWVKTGDMEILAEKYRQSLSIASHHARQPVQFLSGGNQQKVVLGRWLEAGPKILMVDEPTRGVDVGAKAEVHLLLRQLASTGILILLISSDLPELVALADRILVLRNGRLTAELSGAEATQERVLHFASMAVAA